MSPRSRALFVFAFLAALAPSASAQVGVTTDLITGVVTAKDSTPLNGAVIEVVGVQPMAGCNNQVLRPQSEVRNLAYLQRHEDHHSGSHSL